MPKYTPENTSVIGRNARVFLDGTEVEDAVEADTDEGYVVRYVRDENGKRVHDGIEVQRERVRGKVAVSFEDDGIAIARAMKADRP